MATPVKIVLAMPKRQRMVSKMLNAIRYAWRTIDEDQKSWMRNKIIQEVASDGMKDKPVCELHTLGY